MNGKNFKYKTACNFLLVTASIATAYIGSSPASAFTVGSLNPDSAPGSEANKAPYTIEITTDDIGKTFKTYWILEGETSSPLRAKGYFTVTDLTSSLLSLETTFSNQTDASYQATITSLGLGVTPNATSASFNPAGSVFDYTYVETGAQRFPGGYQGIDVCISSGATVLSGTCRGGNASFGLQSGGNKDNFSIDIAGNYGTDPVVSLQTLPVRFRTEEGNYVLMATKPHTVPTPSATLGLLGLGALGMFSTFKRNLKHKQKSAQTIIY